METTMTAPTDAMIIYIRDALVSRQNNSASATALMEQVMRNADATQTEQLKGKWAPEKTLAFSGPSLLGTAIVSSFGAIPDTITPLLGKISAGQGISFSLSPPGGVAELSFSVTRQNGGDLQCSNVIFGPARNPIAPRPDQIRTRP